MSFGEFVASGATGEQLSGKSRAGEQKDSPAECCPDEGGGRDHGQIAEMAVMEGQEADAGVGSGKTDAGGEEGTG